MVRDLFYKYVESISSSLCSWAWRKRWGNRQNGTGYQTPDKARVLPVTEGYYDSRRGRVTLYKGRVLPVPDYIEKRRAAYSKAMEKKT